MCDLAMHNNRPLRRTIAALRLSLLGGRRMFLWWGGFRDALRASTLEWVILRQSSS